MIESPRAQGTNEWRMERLGIPTASAFDQIITPKTLKPSAQSFGYICRLLSERITGEPAETQDGQVETLWMVRGRTLESEAFAAYDMLTGRMPRSCGFCWPDESRQVGCSPDALVGDDGLLEIKCPSLTRHLQYVLTGGLPAEYLMQVQGELYCTGRPWADFISYYPGTPLHVVRVEPDEAVQLALGEAIPEFLARLESQWARLAEAGYRRAA